MDSHGSTQLAAVTVDAYNAELKDTEGFVGDRASNRAFQAIIDEWNQRLHAAGESPLDATSREQVVQKSPAQLLDENNPSAASLLHEAIEDFSRELATVVRRFLQLKAWNGTQRIVVGGGLRASPAGEHVIGRASMLLKKADQPIELIPISRDPDEAGLIGVIHLAPRALLARHEAILAVDIGGSKIRAGIVALNQSVAADFSAATLEALELWRHRDDKPRRDDVVAWLAGTLDRLRGQAREQRIDLASFIGIGCPGLIRSDGCIARGGQNLPGGNWEDERFKLPVQLCEMLSRTGFTPIITMHNDAVVQGLSELTAMRDIQRWGILTIGTGLGNARFTNGAKGPSPL
jgi:hypothetical protein